ncbi:hypothetical protein HDE_01777 [Halotydeus destructor]|nr:hypothetical protein HDE_01777 [Halotydeus destructor]
MDPTDSALELEDVEQQAVKQQDVPAIVKLVPCSGLSTILTNYDSYDDTTTTVDGQTANFKQELLRA